MKKIPFECTRVYTDPVLVPGNISSLLELSNEILLRITSFFKYDSYVNAFMQTCTRLYFLLHTNFYRHNVHHSGSSGFIWADQHRVAPTLRKLIEEGASTDQKKKKNGTLDGYHLGNPLRILGCGEGLLESGMNPDPTGWAFPEKKKKGEGNDDVENRNWYQHLNSPVCQALANGQEAMVQIVVVVDLLMKYVSIDKVITTDPNRDALMIIAIPCGYTSVVSKMLQTKNFGHNNQSRAKRIFMCNHNRRLPLSLATEKGHTDIVALLLEYSADMYSGACYDIDYKMPFLLVISKGHVEIVGLFLKKGIDLDRPGRYGLEKLREAQYTGY